MVEFAFFGRCRRYRTLPPGGAQPVEKSAGTIKPEQVFGLQTGAKREKTAKCPEYFRAIRTVCRHPVPDGGYSISGRLFVTLIRKRLSPVFVYLLKQLFRMPFCRFGNCLFGLLFQIGICFDVGSVHKQVLLWDHVLQTCKFKLFSILCVLYRCFYLSLPLSRCKAAEAGV